MKEETIIKHKDGLLTNKPLSAGDLLYGKELSKKIREKYKKNKLNEKTE